MNRIVFVDPGVHCCGLALVESKRLVDCALLKFESLHAIRSQIETYLPDAVVCEVPQSYAMSKQKGDQNDLIELATVVGAVCSAAPKSNKIKPRSWKGSMDKDAHQRERILPAIESRFPAIALQLKTFPKTLKHNVIDACGLAIWWIDNKPSDR